MGTCPSVGRVSLVVAPREGRRHAAAVARLQASYAALPPGAPVRLAKTTTNLFRPRVEVGTGLDVSGLDGVLSVDPESRRAEVQGMCTYERLVAATLPHGLIPLVVPQLRTITLGGAVSGLGIESTSFRSGLPHESVLEMDVLTGGGTLVTCRPGDDLFDAFPSSYGSLGYATRLRIELEPIGTHVALRHVAFPDVRSLAAAVEEVVATRRWEGERVDGMDGVAFAPGELRLTLARFGAEPGPVSDYTRTGVYWRSVQERETDLLTAHDYVWRWDTDWFWCSRAFGLGHPVVRRFWPRRWRRSDVYQRLVALDRRVGLVDRLDARAGRPTARARRPGRRGARRGARGVPVVVRPGGRDAAGVAVPAAAAHLSRRGRRTRWSRAGPTSTSASGAPSRWDPEAVDSPLNRAVEAKVSELGGHKSLYSEAFYDRETFDGLYGGPDLAEVKRRYDPDDRLTSLYDKVVHRR